MAAESMLVLTPISMVGQYEVSRNFAAYFMSIVALIVCPFSFLISNLLKKYSERRILFLLLVICLIASIGLVNLPLLDVSLIRFMFFYSILFVACNILESVDSVLLAKMFPPNLNLGIVNSGFMIILTTSGGRFVGSILITILGLLFDLNQVYDALMSFYTICFAGVTFLIYWNYENLRVKAINRIIRAHDH